MAFQVKKDVSLGTLVTGACVVAAVIMGAANVQTSVEHNAEEILQVEAHVNTRVDGIERRMKSLEDRQDKHLTMILNEIRANKD